MIHKRYLVMQFLQPHYFLINTTPSEKYFVEEFDNKRSNSNKQKYPMKILPCEMPLINKYIRSV